jgi:hypothetical protein
VQIQDIEENITANYPKMRLQGLTKKEAGSHGVEKFIELLLTDYVKQFSTIIPFTQTVLTTIAKKRRSLGDIYQIVKYYYPKVSLIDVIDPLVYLVKEKQGFRYTYCRQTQRKMFYYHQHSANYVEKHTNDEWGNSYDTYFK